MCTGLQVSVTLRFDGCRLVVSRNVPWIDAKFLVEAGQ